MDFDNNNNNFMFIAPLKNNYLLWRPPPSSRTPETYSWRRLVTRHRGGHSHLWPPFTQQPPAPGLHWHTPRHWTTFLSSTHGSGCMFNYNFSTLSHPQVLLFKQHISIAVKPVETSWQRFGANAVSGIIAVTVAGVQTYITCSQHVML